MGLVSKLLGREKHSDSEENTRRIVLPSREDDKPAIGEYSVPSPLKQEGIYAVEISQAEMYDLGNISFISHFIVYDRNEKIAIDITSDIKPAPLLSQTRPAEVLGKKAVDVIEQYLTGKLKPEYTRFPQGVKYFKASELDQTSHETLRARTVNLRDAKKSLDTATTEFRKEAVDLAKKYFPQQEKE